MKRREFITLLGGAAMLPFAVRAENSDRVRRVGVIMGFSENDEVWQAYLATFRQGLNDLGWTDGHRGPHFGLLRVLFAAPHESGSGTERRSFGLSIMLGIEGAADLP